VDVTVIRGAALPEHEDRWAALQEEHAEFASRFLRPEYMIAVAALRKDVFVARVEDGGEVVRFLSYDQELARHSPRRTLVPARGRGGGARDGRVLDLGPGDAVYKTRLRNGQVERAAGAIPRRVRCGPTCARTRWCTLAARAPLSVRLRAAAIWIRIRRGR